MYLPIAVYHGRQIIIILTEKQLFPANFKSYFALRLVHSDLRIYRISFFLFDV